jgi:radical S-adenosyl methionine domain-containing protein 2
MRAIITADSSESVSAGRYLDILAVSCDSFDSYTNATIGRQHKNKDHLESLFRVREWCRVHEVGNFI